MSFADFPWRGRSRPLYALIAILASAWPMPPGLAQEAGALSERLGRLEGKVRDLQVTLGAIESFIRAKPGVRLPQEVPVPTPQVQVIDPSLGPRIDALETQIQALQVPALAPQVQASDPGLGPRIDALETQIKALTIHIEQIGKQMSALEAKLSALELTPPPPPVPAPTQVEPPPLRQGEAPLSLPPQEAPPVLHQGEAPPPPADMQTASVGSADADDDENFDPSKPRWYGPKPGSDEFAALLQREAGGDSPAGDGPQNLTAALPGADAQSLYQQGYGALLQKDYAGAEGAFRQLVDAYPNDPLAADAQYWVGETYYVRGQYKNAADAFLKGYKKYKSGQKAPDTLLKLGVSLAELGQKDAACSTFDELKIKFPRAPAHVSDEAKAWRKKAGC